MLTATIESVLNRGLPRSPRAQQLCAELAGRKVAVAIRDIARVQVESTGIALRLGRAQGAVDAEITGGPLGLLALTGPTPEAVIQRGEVRIDGDAELAQKFRELGRLLRPDLEEELSPPPRRCACASDRTHHTHCLRLDAQSRTDNSAELRRVSCTRAPGPRIPQRG